MLKKNNTCWRIKQSLKELVCNKEDRKWQTIFFPNTI